MVSILYSEGEVRFVVDGALTSIGTNTYIGGETFAANTNPLAIACVNNEQYFAGVIDEVQLSSQARDTSWVILQHLSLLRRLLIPGTPEVRN